MAIPPIEPRPPRPPTPPSTLPTTRPPTVNDFDEATFQSWYGRWAPFTPTELAGLLAGSDVLWWIVGGRAARVGAPAREHEDTDVALRCADLSRLREYLADWHLWQNLSGSLYPLLPGHDPEPGLEQLWLRRDADHPWVADVAVQYGDDDWVFKKDNRVRLPWSQALHTVDGVRFLRPELALLHKAHLNRPKDRADLDAAVLTPQARAWLAQTLTMLGHHGWADRVAAGPADGRAAGDG
jgi:hypothetical protein